MRSKIPRATAMYSLLVGIKNINKRGGPGDVRACLSSMPRPTWQARSPFVAFSQAHYLRTASGSRLHAIIIVSTLQCASAVCETVRTVSVTEIRIYIHTYIHTCIRIYIHTNVIRQCSRIRCLALRCSAIIYTVVQTGCICQLKPYCSFASYSYMAGICIVLAQRKGQYNADACHVTDLLNVSIKVSTNW